MSSTRRAKCVLLSVAFLAVFCSVARAGQDLNPDYVFDAKEQARLNQDIRNIFGGDPAAAPTEAEVIPPPPVPVPPRVEPVPAPVVAPVDAPPPAPAEAPPPAPIGVAPTAPVNAGKTIPMVPQGGDDAPPPMPIGVAPVPPRPGKAAAGESSDAPLRLEGENTAAYAEGYAIDSLKGARIGVIAGSSHGETAQEEVEDARIIEFPSTGDLLGGLYDNKVDAIVLDEPVAKTLAANNPLLLLIEEKLREEEYAFGVRYYLDELYAEVDAAIKGMKADGTLADMTDRWLERPASERSMPPLREDPASVVLRMGVAPVVDPFCYYDENRKPTGFDIELARRVAIKTGRQLELVEMPMEDLIPAAQAGTVEMVGSCIAVTPDLAKKVKFTESYHRGGVVAVILAK